MNTWRQKQEQYFEWIIMVVILCSFEDNSLKEWSFKKAITIQTYSTYHPIPVPLNLMSNAFLWIRWLWFICKGRCKRQPTKYTWSNLSYVSQFNRCVRPTYKWQTVCKSLFIKAAYRLNSRASWGLSTSYLILDLATLKKLKTCFIIVQLEW